MRNLLVMAHRGYSAQFPENSRLAFVKAIEVGAEAIECDLHKSKDGAYVVLHDDSVDRTSNGTGRVADLTLAQLRDITFAGEQRILTLEELVALVPRGILLNVELKSETVQKSDLPKIASTLRPRGSRVMISTFDHALAKSAIETGLQVGLLIGEEHRSLGFTGLVRRISSYRPYSVNLPFQMVEQFGTIRIGIICRWIRLMGIRVMFWTVNKERPIQLIKDWTDVVITDEVEKALQWCS
jgi:glycerophosphoryl diester phosphodiesterase